MLLSFCSTAFPGELTPLAFQNPNLTVDLGVGLWAFPMPMDFDGDGLFDLVVSCPDKPYNGTYVFQNPGRDTAAQPLPIFKKARRISNGLQFAGVSTVGGSPRVLTPNAEYPDFLKSGLASPQSLGLKPNIHPNKVRGNFWRIADYDGDGPRI